ncbi:MAG: redoxin domain-containing protein [Flavobacteriales bacterium]|nr:redoxin domain-containing protein [Flavobacteriales bacterium]
MKNALIVILTVLLAGSVALNVLSSAPKPQSDIQVDEPMDSLMQYKAILELLTSSSKAQFRYSGHIFKDFTVKDINNNEVPFSSLLDENNSVIFKFSKYNCSVCIEKEVERLAKLSEKVGENRIIILSEGHSIRETLAFVQDRKLNIKVFTIPVGAMDDVMEKENMPFVCIMNRDMKADMFFIPIKEMKSYTDSYHDIIFDRYLKN